MYMYISTRQCSNPSTIGCAMDIVMIYYNSEVLSILSSHLLQIWCGMGECCCRSSNTSIDLEFDKRAKFLGSY